jgi:hypothetical protein
MMVVSGSVETYGRDGQSVAGSRRSRLVDEAI